MDVGGKNALCVYTVTDLQARPVELWLHSLALPPKSKVHIRGLLHVLWDFAMLRGDVSTQRNPMEPVTIKGGDETHGTTTQLDRGGVPKVRQAP